MKKIGLLSDTHSFLDSAVFKHFEQCDEIWHAGDFGAYELITDLQNFKPLRGVYGNIDNKDVRLTFPEHLHFECEGVKVWMTHIGGYPPKYTPALKPQLQAQPPQLFISGHSHILKVMYDDALKCLHMNPGAAGKVGWHAIRTLLRFSITDDRIHDLQVIELGKK